MSVEATQTLYATIASAIFCVLIYRLGRRQLLSFRYTIGWLILGFMGVIAGILIPLTSSVAGYLNLAPAALLAISAIILLVILCVQLSISISGLQEQVRKISEQIALRQFDIETPPIEQEDQR